LWAEIVRCPLLRAEGKLRETGETRGGDAYGRGAAVGVCAFQREVL